MTPRGAGDSGGEPRAGESSPGEGPAVLAQRYLEALEAGDVRAAVSAADEAVASRLATPAIHRDVIAPAMKQIGELWREQALTVADEHLASEITLRVLAH